MLNICIDVVVVRVRIIRRFANAFGTPYRLCIVRLIDVEHVYQQIGVTCRKHVKGSGPELYRVAFDTIYFVSEFAGIVIVMLNLLFSGANANFIADEANDCT